MPIATRLTSDGTLLVNGDLDEVTLTSGSISFNGSTQYLTVPDNAALEFGSGNFTIECWVYLVGTGVGTLLAHRSSATTFGIALYKPSGTTLNAYFSSNGSGWDIFNGASIGTLTQNAWTHISVCRSGSNWYTSRNGVVTSIGTSAASIFDATSSWSIGADLDGNPFNGYISNLRIVNGSALYTANFTPPYDVLPAVANTALLLNVVNSTDVVKDSSTNNFTVTNVNSATFNSNSPFQQGTSPPGSISLNGSTQYLTVPDNAAFDFGSGNFTIECWIYPTSVAAEAHLYGQRTSTAAFSPVILGIRSGGVYMLASDGASWVVNGAFASGTAVTVDTWSHIAMVRNGSSFVTYLNGVSALTGTSAATLLNSTASVSIGAGTSAGNNPWPGYITNFRVVDGTAVYTSNFTPPTTPLSPIANTSLLLNVVSSATLVQDSSSNNFTVTNVGTATFNSLTPYVQGFQTRFKTNSTSVLNFELDEIFFTTGAISFNGSTQYLTTPAGLTTSMGTGLAGNIITMEMWVYPTSWVAANSYVCGVFGAYQAVAANGRWFIRLNGAASSANGTLAFNWTTGTGSETSVTYPRANIPINAWTHIAVVINATTSSSTTINLFVNGVIATFTGNNLSTQGTYYSAPTIGGNYSAFINNFAGYISNLRVVTGTAVYTASFTPPVAALTAIDKTSLLLNTPYNSAAFLDSSTNNFTMTNVGAATSVSFNPFSLTSGGSLIFNGSNQYLSVPYNTALDLSSGDWTIELWWFPTVTATNQNLIMINYAGGDGYAQARIQATTSNTFFILASATGSAWLNATGYGSWSIGSWYHLAFVRNGSAFTLYVNGVSAGTYSSASNLVSSTGATNVGRTQATINSQYARGYISDVRVVKGTAVYTAAFSPPTTPLTAIANTSLMLSTPNSNNAVLDTSINNFTVTNNNSVTSTIYSPYTVGSISFASGRYLTTPAGSATTIVGGTLTSNKTLTIECWCFITAYSTGTAYSSLIGDQTPLSSLGYWTFGPDSGGKLLFYWFDGAEKRATGNTTIPLNTWTHIAVSISSGAIKLFVNGIIQTITGTSTLTNASGSVGYLAMGQWNSGDPARVYTGYVSNLRVVNNTSLYSTSFTPPFAPLTAITNTTLLLNTQNGGAAFADNSTNDFTLTNVSVTSITATPFTVNTPMRLLSTGTQQVDNIFDEFTGAPVVDANLMVWLDAAQSTSYAGSGSTWTDLSGNAKNYTLFNAPTYSSTTGGGVITFDGASSEYATSAASLFDSTTYPTYTINIWVYPTGAGNFVQVDGQTTPNSGYHYSAIEISAAGVIKFGQWTGSLTTVATSSQSLNTWYNLVITYSSNLATAYVNGASVGTSATTWSAPGASTFVALMAIASTNMGTGSYASGSVGAFMVYNRALTADEVTTNFNALRGRYGI